MLEEIKRKEVDKRDKQLPQNFEQLIQMYDLDKLWAYIGQITDCVNNIYPVGAIYISVSDINPSILFGGTWEQIKDKFLLSSGDTYEAGSIGGESEHTLTINEMPSHSHVMRISTDGTAGGGDRVILQSNGVTNNEPNISAGNTINNGANWAHNNMPPYLAVYVWKRIN